MVGHDSRAWCRGCSSRLVSPALRRHRSRGRRLLDADLHPCRPSCSKEAIIIDPVLEQLDRDLAMVRALGCELTLAFNTHCHADHITATGKMKAAVGSGLRSALKGVWRQGRLLLEPDQVVTWAGGTRQLKVLATPGHTNGCVSYYDEAIGAVFTGDALFIGGCGRTDFQEGSAATLYESVHTKLFTLPGDTLVYPAHDYMDDATTITAEAHQSAPHQVQGPTLSS